jgi:carbonic anhydrase
MCEGIAESFSEVTNLHAGNVIQDAATQIANDFGSIMSSILYAVHELKVDTILVVGHSDCKLVGGQVDSIKHKMLQRSIDKKVLQTLQSHLDLDNWLESPDNPRESVINSVKKILNHPLFPRDVEVHGLILNPSNETLEVVETENPRT